MLLSIYSGCAELSQSEELLVVMAIFVNSALENEELLIQEVIYLILSHDLIEICSRRCTSDLTLLGHFFQ